MAVCFWKVRCVCVCGRGVMLSLVHCILLLQFSRCFVFAPCSMVCF